ncbi:MAG TPA: hypothetical protein VN375_05735 [Vicinamibacteria bacterium]|jgi:hypothetical protein|nr:hypothetical protein [Vicinamibacteria bacterium]
MSRRQPRTDCHELTFRAGFALDDPGEVALEDYARALTRAREAEAVRDRPDTARVKGVHVCGLASPPAPQILVDLEAFARDLAVHHEGSGLGWA